jgi:hypothetical protein
MGCEMAELILFKIYVTFLMGSYRSARFSWTLETNLVEWMLDDDLVFSSIMQLWLSSKYSTFD